MIESEMILLFVFMNGRLAASEGSLRDLQEGQFFFGISPETKKEFVIVLSNVMQIEEVPRRAVHEGPSRIIKPDKTN